MYVSRPLYPFVTHNSYMRMEAAIPKTVQHFDVSEIPANAYIVTEARHI